MTLLNISIAIYILGLLIGLNIAYVSEDTLKDNPTRTANRYGMAITWPGVIIAFILALLGLFVWELITLPARLYLLRKQQKRSVEAPTPNQIPDY